MQVAQFIYLFLTWSVLQVYLCLTYIICVRSKICFGKAVLSEWYILLTAAVVIEGGVILALAFQLTVQLDNYLTTDIFYIQFNMFRIISSFLLNICLLCVTVVVLSVRVVMLFIEVANYQLAYLSIASFLSFLSSACIIQLFTVVCFKPERYLKPICQFFYA